MSTTCLLAAWLLAAAPAPSAPAPAGDVDFSGTWKLDLKASDPLDELLAAQGASWIERKAAGSIEVTQKVARRPEGLEICVESSLKSKCTTTRIGAGWEQRETDQGKARARTDWSSDVKALVTTSEIVLKDGKAAKLTVTRTLEDGGRTTVQRIELKIEGGKAYTVRRVLRRQGA